MKMTNISPMKIVYTFIWFLALVFPVFLGDSVFWAGVIPQDWLQAIEGSSITTSPTQWDNTVEDKIRWFGYKIFSLAKIVISGLALVFIVIIGAKMVSYSDNEEKIKTQRKQITYVLIGFLFLNIPGFIYQFFGPRDKSATIIEWQATWSNVLDFGFWDPFTANPILQQLIGFLRVFIFSIAVLMFTWAAFRLIVSWGDEEQKKMAKNRFVYGTLALVFLGFVEIWSRVIAIGDFFGSGTQSISTLGQKLFGLAIFFAGPVAIFFLILGGYYYITSGGDEERTKKGKAIITNTFIAAIILIAMYTFLADLITFTL